MRRRILVLLVLLAPSLSSVPARAEPAQFNFMGALRIAGSSVTVPLEWDGVWATSDSVYDCTTGFRSTSPGSDTLCAGQVFSQNVPGSPISFDCSGTADATTYHVTCSGSADVLGCQVTYDIQTDGTRTGTTYRSVTTSTTTYSGTGVGCNLIPSTCTRIVSYGTRTGPAPTTFCSTPVRNTTWGRLKVIYR